MFSQWAGHRCGTRRTSNLVTKNTHSGSRRSESDSDSESDDSDGDQVIATCDEDDCDGSEDGDPMGEERAECDGGTPLDEVIAKIQYTDAGVVSSDPRLKDHDPASFEPDLCMAKKEENNLLAPKKQVPYNFWP